MARRKDVAVVEEDDQHDGANIAGKFSKKRLKSFVDKIEKLEEEKRATATDISGLYKEAEGAGFNAKALRAMITDRRKDQEIVREREDTKRIYKEALGDFSSTPLGTAATED